MDNDLILLNETQVATILGISPKTLQAWRVRGVGPRFVKVGRLVKYLRANIQSWTESQGRQSTSEGSDG